MKKTTKQPKRFKIQFHDSDPTCPLKVGDRVDGGRVIMTMDARAAVVSPTDYGQIERRNAKIIAEHCRIVAERPSARRKENGRYRRANKSGYILYVPQPLPARVLILDEPNAAVAAIE